jgi:cation transport regulator ChaB
MIKGSNIVMPVKALRSLPERARKTLPAELHQRYLEDRILVSSWYPEDEALTVLKAYVQLTPGLGSRPYAAIGRLGALQHARDLYKHHADNRDMDEVFEKAHALWRSFHDTGTVHARRTHGNEGELSIDGYAALCEEWCEIICGYFEGFSRAVTGGGAVCELISADLEAKNGIWRLRWTSPG